MRLFRSLVTTLVFILNYAEFGSQMNSNQSLSSNHHSNLFSVKQSPVGPYFDEQASVGHSSIRQSSVSESSVGQSFFGHSFGGKSLSGQSSVLKSPVGHLPVGQSSFEQLYVERSSIRHSSSVQHYNSHNDAQVHSISTSRAPGYNITALAQHFDIYPTLVVHHHSLHHHHVETYPSSVTPLTDFDENSLNPGLRHAKLRLSPGYFRLNKETTEYIPVRPFTNMRLLLSVPDMCILGFLDGSDIFWGLYAIYNGTIQRVLIPRSRKYAELMLLDEILEYPDQRIFLKQLLPRKRKQKFPLSDENV